MPQYLENSSAFIYADDIALLVKGHDINEIELSLTSEFKIISKWFNANRLSVNNTKTNVMLFSGSRSKHRNGVIKVPVGANTDEVLTQVSTVKYLGVELDEHLTFVDHVDKLCRKIKSRTGVLWRMRHFINENLAKDLYLSLIHPHFNYADVVYDACNQQCKSKLQVHQNMALRAIKNVEPRFPTDRLHAQTGIDWLDVEQKRRCCIEAFKGIQNMSSTNVNNLFPKTMPMRHTRSNDFRTFEVPNNRTKFGNCNLPNRCKKYWHQLPAEITNIDILSSFKSCLKTGGFFVHEH